MLMEYTLSAKISYLLVIRDRREGSSNWLAYILQALIDESKGEF